MDARQTLRMNPGDGETSYARNSTFQSAEQSRIKPLIEEAVKQLFCTNDTPRSMVIADLGCSCGPSALTLVSSAVDAIHYQCLQLQQPPPELSLLLNDLPNNDFNTLLKQLDAFQNGHNSQTGVEDASPLVLASIVPGSFCGRRFTTGSLHVVVSSASLHWLSQVPEDLVKNGIPMYQATEKLQQKMRPAVHDAYARQFRKDFTLFLRCRAQEVMNGGRMVLSFIGTQSIGPANESTQSWELAARILYDMASRGEVDKDKLKSFYIPIYGPTEKEVKDIIEEQGSFSISAIQSRDSFSGMNKALINPKTISYSYRATLEPLIRDHFGSSEKIMDEFARTMEQHLSQVNLEDEHGTIGLVYLAMSLARKT